MTLGYIPCDNPEHDWDDSIRFCKTCHVPIKQYTGKEAVEKMQEIQRSFVNEQ